MDQQQQQQNNNILEAEEKVQILNQSGLHGRPTTMFVKLAKQYSSAISICRSDDPSSEEVNGKSAIALLSLGLESGVHLLIRAKGKDAGDAVSALSALVKNKFEEA